MGSFAMMSGNIVSNIIMADNKEATETALNCKLIEYTAENPAGIGWTYDEETGKFNPPEQPTQDDESRKQSILDRLGLTQEEFNLLTNN